MIRKAVVADIPQLVELGRRFHAAKQDLYPFVAEDTANFFAGLLAAPNAPFFVSEKGFICGQLSGAPSNASYITAFEFFWWSEDRSGLRLLDAFEAEAKELGAHDVHLSHPVEELGVAKIVKRRGYAPLGKIHRKEL
jgi:hypothetical protein